MNDIICSYHPDAILIEDYRAGDLVCPECGLVVGERLCDIGTEWRSFNNENSKGNDPSRVGAPENRLLGESDLSTTIAVGFGSSEKDQALFNSQRKNKNNTDRQMMQAIGTINEMGDRIHLTKPIKERAQEYYKRCLDNKICKGKPTEAKAAACIYIACRKESVPRSFKEICAIAMVNKKEIGRCFKEIVNSLEKTIRTQLSQVTSADYMTRFCRQLDLPHLITMAATRIAKMAVELDIVAGRSPVSVTAAAIYMAVNAGLNSTDRPNAKAIGDITGAAEVTVKTTYKLMYPKAKELFPDDFKFEVPVELLQMS
ncbi:hypothetical protein L596_021293 [Steinernema carpocapsae]|uniref:Transcription initiation factor IIB n=1 Tax=Steinernema carpocapsae TaxID=34508 RepID=A0A4V5ZZV8_STECR|nr:hypothetical protein L596_021293 [Steinernema carpocapsae]